MFKKAQFLILMGGVFLSLCFALHVSALNDGAGNEVFSSNIGIKTRSPTSTLDVNGTLTTNGFKLTTSPGLNKVLTSDATGNGSWATSSSITGDYILLTDQRADGTVGGSCSGGATWDTRVLNTIITDETGLISLSSNQATLPAGTYECEIDAEIVNTRTTQLRLRNVTDGTIMTHGRSAKSDYFTSATASLKTKFTLSSSKALRIEARCERPYDTNDYGIPTTFTGSVETYMYMNCRRT